jgi:ribonuclease HII
LTIPTAALRGHIEKKLLLEFAPIVGVDEVGRGCLAGPVFAAAAVLDYDRLWRLSTCELALIRDSKTLSHLQRTQAQEIIRGVTADCAIASASVEEIERFGIVGATFMSMHRAIESLQSYPQFLLIDGNQKLPDIEIQQMSVVGGDSACYNIAAASILAKNARDQFMVEIAEKYQGYGFEKHVGYGTKQHMDAMKELGICNIHRRTFAPVQALIR